MNKIVVEKPGKIVIEETAKPCIELKNQILVKIKVAGICGSDVHIYHGTSPVATYPRVIGHEMVGIIEEVGEEVTTVKVGQRVIIDQIKNCGKCYPCENKRSNVCCHLEVRGVHIDGGFREYIVVNEDEVYILPDSITLEEAVMIEPMSIAFQAVSRGEITSKDKVFIYGAGALGTSLVKAVKTTGAKICICDIMDSKLESAKKLGADFTINSTNLDVAKELELIWGDFGPTVSIDAVGLHDSIEKLVDLTINSGRIVSMGFLDQPINAAQFKITAKELDIRGSRLQYKQFPKVIKAYEDKKISFSGSISHTFNYLDVQKAFDLIESKDPSVKKIVLTF